MFFGATDSNQKIVTSGLVLNLDASQLRSYPGASGTTTWYDLSGNNNNFTFFGPTFSSVNGGSIVFDGVSNYLLKESLVLNYNNNFTIQFWFYPSTLGDSVNGFGLFFNGVTSSNTNRVQIAVNPNGSVNLVTVGSSVGDDFTSSSGLVTTGNWYNYVAVRNSGVITVYLNGVSVASGNVNYSVSQQNNLFIGFIRSSGALWYLNGRISNVSIYNKALTAAEILQNYNVTKARFGL